MGIRRLAFFCFLPLFASVSLWAQQATSTASRDAQGVLLLQRSYAVLVGPTTIQDVTLTGNATQTVGPDTDTGTATLEATAVGQSRVDLSLSSGEQTEVRDLSPGSMTGSWLAPDGAWHPIAGQNLFSDPTWFFPAFLIRRVLSNAGYAISPADAETLNGQSVEHVSVFEEYAGAQQLPSQLQGLSQIDVYLNASNLLPAAIAFNMHPDNDAQTNIPVRIEFSNYQSQQGAAVPCHIQKYINNSLVLDLTVDGVQFNTSPSASDFTAQ